MNGIRNFLVTAFLTASCMMATSCDKLFDSENDEEEETDRIEEFQVKLNYNHLNPSSFGGFDADKNKVVSSTNPDADFVITWHYQFGFVVTQPCNEYIRNLFADTNDEYNNPNSCIIQNFGRTELSNFGSKEALRDLPIVSGSYYDEKNIAELHMYDIIGFVTNSGVKGVARVQLLEADLNNYYNYDRFVSLQGYLYYPCNLNK